MNLPDAFFSAAAIKRGGVLRPLGNGSFMPPFCITPREIDLTVNTSNQRHRRRGVLT